MDQSVQLRVYRPPTTRRDVVGRALAQLSGGPFTPVAFSFGWVAYATSAVVSAVGDHRLMPASVDTSCVLMNGRNGYVRDNGSWVLGRVMRDYHYWMNDEVRAMTNRVVQAAYDEDVKRELARPDSDRSEVERRIQAGLVVSLWEASATQRAGVQGKDFLYWSGFVVMALQLGIAAVPCGVYGNWGVLLVTASALALCLFTGSLRQWKVERWACRPLKKGKDKIFVLTRGNGAQHAIVIDSKDGHGLDLEDLATGFSRVDYPMITTFARAASVVLGVLWVLLLITASALVTDAWFLMAIGGLGMLQNMFVAGYSRAPAAQGLPLDYKGVVGHHKVLETLIEVEKTHHKVGRNMADIFFPGGLRPHEVERFDRIQAEFKERQYMENESRGK